MGANPGKRNARASVRPSILVVEDEPLVSRGLMLLAGKFGQAHLAPTVAAARMALESIDDWVAFVIDVGLPDGSGMDVLARAREMHPRASALVLTGQLSPQIANAAFDLRAVIVAKPVDTARLAGFLQEALSGATNASLFDTARDWATRYALSIGEADVLLKSAALPGFGWLGSWV